MNEFSEDLLKGIKEILSSSNNLQSRTERYNFIQSELVEIFNRNSFFSMIEYKISFYSFYKKEVELVRIDLSRGGSIDVYAKKKDLLVAIEFDSGRQTKWNSLKKLLMSDAKHCFALVYGGSRKKYTFEHTIQDNLHRIKYALIELMPYIDKIKAFDKLYQILSKSFWIGIVRYGFLKQLNLNRLISCDLFNLDNKDKDELYRNPECFYE